MAGLLDEEELLPVFSNPNIARQGARARALAARRNVNTLPDPRTYAAVQGLLGTRPDEMGFSVLNPAYEDIRRVADPAFAVGTALGVAPLMGMARFSRPVQQASAASQRGAVRATKGLPVGMGIKDVSSKMGINVNQGGSSFADKIISGEKKFETRESDSLRAYVGKRVGIIRTGEGKAKAIGEVTLGEPIVVSSPEEFAKLRALHLVPEGSKFDIKPGGVKYLYPIEDPVPYGVEKNVAKYGIVSRKILDEPDTLEKALYPQEEALRLAQQRAALPVEQGGLGLPKDNTPMDRARAMGFDTETSYIHSTTNPFTKINEDAKFSGIFTLPNYSANYGTSNMPLVAKGEIATSDDLRRLVKRPTKKMQMAIDEIIPENVDISDATVEMQKLRNELARKYGFSGVKVSDEFGQDTVALVKPQNIRSRFAAFDPFRLTPAIAATMGVAAPDLLARTIDDEERRRQLLPGLLAP